MADTFPSLWQFVIPTKICEQGHSFMASQQFGGYLESSKAQSPEKLYV